MSMSGEAPVLFLGPYGYRLMESSNVVYLNISFIISKPFTTP